MWVIDVISLFSKVLRRFGLESFIGLVFKDSQIDCAMEEFMNEYSVASVFINAFNLISAAFSKPQLTIRGFSENHSLSQLDADICRLFSYPSPPDATMQEVPFFALRSQALFSLTISQRLFLCFTIGRDSLPICDLVCGIKSNFLFQRLFYTILG